MSTSPHQPSPHDIIAHYEALKTSLRTCEEKYEIARTILAKIDMRYDWEMASKVMSEQKRSYVMKLYAMEKEMYDKEIERLKEESKRIERDLAELTGERGGEGVS